MIRTCPFGMDSRLADGGGEIIGGDKIIDPPANISGTCTPAVGPPGIGTGSVGMEVAKGIEKAFGEEVGHALALLIGKAGIFAVGLGVGQVDLLMGNIEVATINHRFFCP